LIRNARKSVKILHRGPEFGATLNIESTWTSAIGTTAARISSVQIKALLTAPKRVDSITEIPASKLVQARMKSHFRKRVSSSASWIWTNSRNTTQSPDSMMVFPKMKKSIISIIASAITLTSML